MKLVPRCLKALALLATILLPATPLLAQCNSASFGTGFCYRFTSTFPGGEELEVILEVPDPSGWLSFPSPVGHFHESIQPCGSNFRILSTTLLPGGDEYTCTFEPGGTGDMFIEMEDAPAGRTRVRIEQFGFHDCSLNGGPTSQELVIMAFEAESLAAPDLFANTANPTAIDWDASDSFEEAGWIGPGLGFVLAGPDVFDGGPCTRDQDGDGVEDDVDLCPDTAASDPAAGVPSVELLPNHYADLDGDGLFDFGSPRGRGDGAGPKFLLDIQDTAGCNCSQIIEQMGVGLGHVRHGCSLGLMLDFVAQVPVPTAPLTLQADPDLLRKVLEFDARHSRVRRR